ncbi:MAG TPA: NAD-dependent epimerase/dehydratase family protein [Acidimicrobiales bacterium]|nr:NAD-dependent epimerase/dehydratase family protein [Acidimicrobiales bacterium]
MKAPEFGASAADEFLQLDLPDRSACEAALSLEGGFDEVYRLGADMGGMGFIHSAECEIMRNNALVNLNVVDAAAAAGVPRYFFSSSVCIYRDMEPGEPELDEAQASPALPDNEYGWEKLYAERVAEADGRRSGMAVRIARFQNCYGPEGTWRGGREKAPAAICRKVAEVDDGGTIEVWGDGTAVRSYTYVDDLVDGIVRLMRSGLAGPANIGNPEYVTVDELVGALGAAEEPGRPERRPGGDAAQAQAQGRRPVACLRPEGGAARRVRRRPHRRRGRHAPRPVLLEGTAQRSQAVRHRGEDDPQTARRHPRRGAARDQQRPARGTQPPRAAHHQPGLWLPLRQCRARPHHAHPRAHRPRPPTRTPTGHRSLNRPTFMPGGPQMA